MKVTYLLTYLLSYLVRQSAVRCGHSTFFQMLAVVCINGFLRYSERAKIVEEAGTIGYFQKQFETNLVWVESG